MNDFYSDNELEKMFGKRPEGTAIFQPMELGWVCPVDESHEITWSEFSSHIWCYDCQKDYFSLLCPKQMNLFTTKTILAKEIASMAPLMAEWTLDKYKTLKHSLKNKKGE